MDNKMKEDYIRKQAVELQKIDAELRNLETKIYSTKGNMRAQQQKKLDELKQKRGDINTRLEKLETIGTDAWMDVKRMIETTKNEIHRGIRRTILHLQK
jgi:predicted  nucleic acid-binding Zn-ribbon protein